MLVELYREQIKKRYPNIEDEELKKMVDNYKIEAIQQEGRFRDNEINKTGKFVSTD
jgi:hypothetical protein